MSEWKIAHNVLQIYPVRLSELPQSISTNGYIEDNCFLRRRQNVSKGPIVRRAARYLVHPIG